MPVVVVGAALALPLVALDMVFVSVLDTALVWVADVDAEPEAVVEVCAFVLDDVPPLEESVVSTPPLSAAGAEAGAAISAAAAKEEAVSPEGGFTTPTMPCWQ